MNKTKINIILNSISILIIISFIILSFVAKSKRNNFKPIETVIHIDGLDDNYLISKDDVFYFITKNFSLENQAINVDALMKIEKKLQQIPEISNAQAYIDNNQKLNIKITQREPLFRVFNIYNENYYVDKLGVKFFPKNNTSINVPIVTGNIDERKNTNDTIQNTILKQVYKFCTYTQKDKDWNKQFGQININEHSQIELIPRINNSTILLGNTNDLEPKMNKLKIFFTQVLNKVGWDNYRVINIMYKDQIICLK